MLQTKSAKSTAATFCALILFNFFTVFVFFLFFFKLIKKNDIEFIWKNYWHAIGRQLLEINVDDETARNARGNCKMDT